MRRFIAWLFGMPLVALIDHDGEISVRLGRTNVLGQLWAKRFGLGIRNVTLASDGSCPGGCYLHRWQMVRDYRRSAPKVPS